MAGSSADFDPAEFRTNIRAAMTMGLPSNTADRATFRWTTVKTFTKEDSGGQPFDWTSAPTTTVAHPDVQVPVAVEFLRTTQVDGTPAGNFDMSRVILTLLDEDHVQVAGANMVLLGQSTYDVQFVEPPVGLFSVTVYRWHLRSRDES